MNKSFAFFGREKEVPPLEPRCGAIWAAGINFMFCSIALSDLTPDKLCAYGELSQEGATAVESIRSEIGALLNKLSAYLAKGAGADLQTRLERLGETSDEVRLLSEIERIVAAQGLVEFRGALTMPLDRFESAAFEVGVFGRVSSGKSSLLNYILETDMRKSTGQIHSPACDERALAAHFGPAATGPLVFRSESVSRFPSHSASAFR